METILSFIHAHAGYAHWVVFGCLLLAGFNVPVSEDILIIISGILASTLVPENTWKLFIAVFLGAYLSDWMVYWIGRLWGRKLWHIRWFSKIFHPKRLQQIKQYYRRYGMLTLIIGRFIPFGVRNCLFATAGIGKMRFWKFIIADGIACLLSNATLFTIAYFCGKTCSIYVKFINVGIFLLFLVALIGFIWYKKKTVSID